MTPENVRDGGTTGPVTTTIVQTEGKEVIVRSEERGLRAKALNVEVELNKKFAKSSIQSLDQCRSVSPLKKLITLQVVLQAEDALIRQGKNI